MRNTYTQQLVHKLLVWDGEGAAPSYPNTHIVLWRGYSDDQTKNIHSLFKFIEEHDLELRNRYLEWVYKISQKQFGGKRVVEHLKLRSNLSFWWMTLLAEKCNWAKSPQINDALRLLALEKWCEIREIRHLDFVSSNATLATIFSEWSKENCVTFKWKKIKSVASEKKPWMNIIYRSVPRPLQALIWLIYQTWTRRPLHDVGLDKWRESSSQIMFVSYFANLTPRASMEGRYESRYWGNLPEIIENNNMETRWIHLWIKNDSAVDTRRARVLINQFNKYEHGKRVHVTLDSFFNLNVVKLALKDWIKILKQSRGLEKTLEKKIGTGFNLWPLMCKDWRESILGVNALSNLLNLNQFEAALSNIPLQKKGFYLQENQPWEFGFLAAWRRVPHGYLIGTPHSTILFWDMRYHFEPRSCSVDDKLAVPIPDSIAVNGPISRATLLGGGYPRESFLDVEALRYLHLQRKQKFICHTSNNKNYRILVIADYLLQNTKSQIRLLELCLQNLDLKIDIIFKPHPASYLSLEKYCNFNFTVSTRPLEELFSDCDIAYTSNATTGAVDAYCSGVTVISVLEANSLNLSPLRGLPDVTFVSDPDELRRALITRLLKDSVPRVGINYFNVNKSLSSWRKLISV